MKIFRYTRYGGPEVLKMSEIEKPVPKDDEILVKIHAASVTSGDVRLRSSDFPALFWLPARLIFGLFRPKKQILGHELSGIVEEVGKEVSKFKPGDEVFGSTTMLKAGSYAEYVCLPQEWKFGVVDLKPSNLSFKQAAVLPIGGMTALFLFEKAGLGQSQKVLVYGASGSVGSYAVQIAKSTGADVTGVCSGSNFQMVGSMGADHLIDYKKEDYSQLGQKYDIVFDAVGKTSKARAKKALKPGGSFVTIKMLTKERNEDLAKLKSMAERGDIFPYIDRSYGLNEIVEAHKYVDTGRKRGNVSIDVIMKNAKSKTGGS